MSGISILIPARNESKTIGRTLQSVGEQSTDGQPLEVIVCDNGSTDDTVDQVMRAADQDPRIRLIDEARPGKTHAWNQLIHEASFPTAIFMDADVILAPDVIQRLHTALAQDPQLIVVGAKSIPLRKSLSLWRRFVTAITQPDRFQTWIVGRMYALKRPEFARRMEELKISEMPEILAAEDTWISLVAGTGRWKIDQDAQVFHMPYTLEEFVRIERRHLLSLEELRRQCPQLVQRGRLDKTAAELLKEKLEEIALTKGLMAKTCTALRLPIVGAVRRSVRRELRRGHPQTFQWEVSEASKNFPEQAG